MIIVIFKVEIEVLEHLTLVYTIQNTSDSILVIILISPSDQAVLELSCWDCGFEPRRGRGCLSVWSVVCCQLFTCPEDFY